MHEYWWLWSLAKWFLQIKIEALLWYESVYNFGILVISIVKFLQEAINYSKHDKNNTCNQYNTFQLSDTQNN
jgi:hypothetical protein